MPPTHAKYLLLAVAAIAATCARPSFSIMCDEAFTQVHLALVDGPDKMSVSWTQRCQSDSTDDPEAIALGEKEATSWQDTNVTLRVWQKNAGSTTRTMHEVKNVPARKKRYFMSWHFRAVISELEPDAVYCYQIQDGPGDCFRTGPKETRSLRGVRFASLGDMGTNNSHGTTAALHRNANSYDFVLHDGDIGYGDDLGFVGVGASRMYGPSGYEAIYDEFMDQIEPFARKIPYMTSPGNHDVSCHILYDTGCAPGQRNFSAYRTRFHMPSKESGAGEVEGMWHSFEYANVHIAVIDTETDYKGAPTHPRKRFGGGQGGGFGNQMAWLESDLAHARANAAIDWIIVVGHRQMYSSRSLIHQLSPRVTIALRDAVEILLLRYNVDLYLGAHIHYYERFAPMARGNSCGPAPARGGIYHAPQCPVHIINGAAGSCEPAQSRGSRLANVGHGVYNEYGYAEFHVQNTTHLHGRFIITTDGDEREGDSFRIIKPPPVNDPGSQHKPFALEI